MFQMFIKYFNSFYLDPGIQMKAITRAIGPVVNTGTLGECLIT